MMTTVVIPAGVQPGQPFAVQGPAGTFQVSAPPGMAAGQTLQVQMPVAAPMPMVMAQPSQGAQYAAGPDTQLGTVSVSHAAASPCRCLLGCVFQLLPCFWCIEIPQQPRKTERLKVLIDGEQKGLLVQGQQGNWQVAPGNHSLEVKREGGFLKGLTQKNTVRERVRWQRAARPERRQPTSSITLRHTILPRAPQVGQMQVMVAGGQEARFSLEWQKQRAYGNTYHPVLLGPTMR